MSVGIADVEESGAAALPETQAVKAWRRRMRATCFTLMPVGLAMVIVGAAAGWGAQPMLGFLTGGGGLFLLVLGALCGKFAAVGPVPEGLR